VSHVAAIDDFLARAEFCPEGPAKVALLEEALRLAEAHQDLDQGFRVRRRLFAAEYFAGLPDRMLVTFSWCLSQCDREPNRFPESQLLWPYRWVVDSAVQFPQIDRPRIDGLVADMAQRYRRAGLTLRAVHVLRRRIAAMLDDATMARRAHREMRQEPRDAYSDSVATERTFRILYLIFLGRDQKAVDLAEPYWNGTIRDAYHHGTAVSYLLLPMARQGRAEQARLQQPRALAEMKQNPGCYLDRLAQHLAFFALTDDLGRGVKLLDQQARLALTTPHANYRFEFSLAALQLLKRVVAAGRSTIQLRLPDRLPLFRTDHQYDLGELISWWREQTEALADLFDARNGTSGFRKRLIGAG
jgi:hypothetical protein